MAKDGDDPAGLAGELLAKIREYLPAKGVSLVEDAYAFGGDVAKLVEGVTKLGQIPWQAGGERPGEHEIQAENLRKMLLAMAEDVRVVIVQLADRLHNMRTLWPLPPDAQRRISLAPREIYAPLAGRLGIWQLKWQLDDLAFRYLEPEPYFQIAEMLDARRSGRERYVGQVESIVRRELAKHGGANADGRGRATHI